MPPPPPVPLIPLNSVTQREPRLPTLDAYHGEPNLCRAFLVKCSMFFSLQPQTFAAEESKVALVLTLLSGKAALWGTAVWENCHSCCSSFHALSEEMKRVFDRAVVEAARRLADLRQGERSVSDFSIEFRTLAAECKWNEETQWDVFLHGLADRIQKEIFTLELPTSLDGLIDLALRVDLRLQQHGLQVRHQLLPVVPDYFLVESGRTVSHLSDSEPMQVGRARLSRERRRARGLCLYCGASGHFLAVCPVKEQARQ